MKKKVTKIVIILLIIIFLFSILYLLYNKDNLKYKFDNDYLIIETKDINFLNALTNQLENNNIFVEKLKNNKDLVIKKDDIEKINYLFLENKKIKDITGIEYFVDLEYLYLQENEIKSVESLKELKKLVYLDISENRIEDYNVLSNLSELKYLNLLDNSCNNISFIENLTKLEEFLYGRLVTYKENKAWTMDSKLDISSLEKLQNLRRLTLDGTILDTKPFLNLVNLVYLNLCCNFENFSNFKNLEKLTYLNLSGSNIYDDINEKKYALDFSSFENFINLKQLYLVGTNSVTYEDSINDNDNLLKQIKGISSLEILDISNRLYSKIEENYDYFLGLNNLRELYVDDVGVCSLKPLENLPNLEYLYMRQNSCGGSMDFDKLKEKTKLTHVYMTDGDKKNIEQAYGSKFDEVEIILLEPRGYSIHTPW